MARALPFFVDVVVSRLIMNPEAVITTYHVLLFPGFRFESRVSCQLSAVSCHLVKVLCGQASHFRYLPTPYGGVLCPRSGVGLRTLCLVTT